MVIDMQNTNLYVDRGDNVASNSLYFMNIKLDEIFSTEDIISKLIELDSDDRFVINDNTESTIDGYYITYYNSKEFRFNEDSSILESIIVRKNLIIPFFIDLEKSILDVWSNKSNITRFINNLCIALDNSVEIDPIFIDLEQICEKLKNRRIRVKGIKIDNYILEEDIIANCILDLKNHSNPVEVVKKYSKNLIYLTLVVLTSEDELLTLIVYRTGSIVVYKNREEITLETLEFIRNILIY